jgi:hypothetical protein
VNAEVVATASAETYRMTTPHGRVLIATTSDAPATCTFEVLAVEPTDGSFKQLGIADRVDGLS